MIPSRCSVQRVVAVVLATTIAVWAVRGAKNTSDYGDNQCDSGAKVTTAQQQQQVKGVTLTTQTICDKLNASVPRSCPTTQRTHLYKLSIPKNSPVVVKSFTLTVTNAPATFDSTPYGPMKCDSGPPNVLCSDPTLSTETAMQCIVNNSTNAFLPSHTQSGSTYTQTYNLNLAACQSFKAGQDVTVFVNTDTTTTATASSTVSLSLTTAISSPAVSPSKSGLTYSGQAVGTTSAPQTVNFTNNGTASANLATSITGDFKISAKTCGSTLAVGRTCSVSVTFKPAVKGARTGKLTMTDNESDSPQVVALLGNGNFKAMTNAVPIYGNGVNPNWAALGQFNSADTKFDVALAGCWNQIGVLLGNGNGTFQTPKFYTTDSNSVYSIAGDYNKDGKKDLAVANFGASNITVLFGKGDGTFDTTNELTLFTGGGPVALAEPTLTSSGFLDIVSANSQDGTVSVFLGGVGGFTEQPNSPVPAGNNPVAFDTGDFDGDGHTDVAVADATDGTVTILFGNGDGTFKATVGLVTVGHSPSAIRAVDLNGDRKPDLVVANKADNTVSVVVNNGTGGFLTPKTYAVGKAPVALKLLDVDRNGKQDIAVANRDSNNVTILLNSGTATFTFAGNYNVGVAPSSVNSTTLDGNGSQDLVITNINGMVTLLNANTAP
jgi:hypothetical protein